MIKNKILPVLNIFILASCNTSPLEKIKSSFDSDIVSLKRVEGLDSLVEITSKNQFNNIARYDEVMIIISQDNCSHCNNYFSNLRNIIKKENILIYYFDMDKYLESYNDLSNTSGEFAKLYPNVKGTPTSLFFKNGELKNYLVGEIEEEKFEDTLLQYVSYSNMYLLNNFHKDEGSTNYYIDFEDEHDFPGISTTSLDNKIKDEKNKTILFSWRKCDDCKNYYKYVLYPFLDKNLDKKIYIYEVDGYYSLKNYLDDNNNPNEEYLSLWYDFASKYHLTDYEIYDKYSHRNGVVPTLVSFKNNLYSINVFSNDYGLAFNSDNTLSYSHSFYPEITTIKSKTKVKNNDTNSKEYIKALKELNNLVLEKEVALATEYLSNNL